MFHPGNRFPWNPYTDSTWYMGHLLHYIIPFQNLFQMLFMSLFTNYCWLLAVSALSQHKRTKMLLFFMDIVGIFGPMWIFNGWYIRNFLIGNNTKFYIRKVKPTCYLKHFSMIFSNNVILLNHFKCPYLSILDLKLFKHAMQQN